MNPLSASRCLSPRTLARARSVTSGSRRLGDEVDGEVVDAALVRELLVDEVARQVALSPDEATVDRVRLAAELLEVIALEDTFVDFLTLPAYNRIVSLP